MNAVEIEEAISRLAEQPFDAEEFPFAFLEAFGNKATTIKRLRSGASNKSDLGGVLQINNIHIKVCEEGQVSDTIRVLRESPATKNARNGVKFILATDGIDAGSRRPFIRHRPDRLPVRGFPRSFWLLPAACRYLDRQANPRERLRHQGHGPPEPAVCRAAEGQPRMGHRRTSPRHEPFHGAADLLLLRRRHRHLRQARPVHRHDRADERAGQLEHPRGDQRAVPRHEHQARTSATAQACPVGRRFSLREWRAVLGQHGRAALSARSRALPAPHRQSRLDEDQPRHLRLDDPGRRR